MGCYCVSVRSVTMSLKVLHTCNMLLEPLKSFYFLLSEYGALDSQNKFRTVSPLFMK